MLKYIKAHPVNIALSALFILAFGVTTFFLASSNSDLRQENRADKQLREASEQREKLLLIEVDSLLLSVKQRDKEDSIRAIEDSILVEKLADLNKGIITTRADYTTIRSKPLDEFLVLITGYIDSAQ